MANVQQLTAGLDNLNGIAGDYNIFQLTPATLQATDTVTGGAASPFVDNLEVTAAGTLAAAQFQGVTGVEQLILSSAGNDVTLTNGLVAGTSTGNFRVEGGAGNDIVDASRQCDEYRGSRPQRRGQRCHPDEQPGRRDEHRLLLDLGRRWLRHRRRERDQQRHGRVFHRRERRRHLQGRKRSQRFRVCGGRAHISGYRHRRVGHRHAVFPDPGGGRRHRLCERHQYRGPGARPRRQYGHPDGQPGCRIQHRLVPGRRRRRRRHRRRERHHERNADHLRDRERRQQSQGRQRLRRFPRPRQYVCRHRRQRRIRPDHRDDRRSEPRPDRQCDENPRYRDHRPGELGRRDPDPDGRRYRPDQPRRRHLTSTCSAAPTTR